jgi:hypothetical protein
MAVIYIKPNKDVRVKEMKLKYEITNINWDSEVKWRKANYNEYCSFS